jgi:hypothetical protein
MSLLKIYKKLPNKVSLILEGAVKFINILPIKKVKNKVVKC